MTVKALVNLYETRSTRASPRAPSASSSLTREDAEPHPEEDCSRPLLRATPGSPDDLSRDRRGLTPHPLLRRREPSHNEEADDEFVSPISTHLTEDRVKHHHEGLPNTYQASSDIADELPAATGRSYFRVLYKTDSSSPYEPTSHSDVPPVEMHELPCRDDEATSTFVSSSGTTRSLRAGRQALNFPLDTGTPTYSSHSSTTLVPLLFKSGSIPVPLSTIFEREAAPLSLPQLDKYIESLPAHSFPSMNTVTEGEMKTPVVQMFPPMDHLATAGKSLADLEHNSTVAPGWRNRTSIFSGLTSVALAITGSSALASFYSVQGLFDTLQIFALILNTLTSHSGTSEERWRKLFLITIPNALALNFASTVTESLILLVILMAVSGLLLWCFYRISTRCYTVRIPEGLQKADYPTKSWLLVLVTFILTILYLPLSTMAVHVLVWSSDLWVVPNPYINATSNPPQVPPLGPANQYRAPLDFCWTTTMEMNSVNYAPIVVILAIISFAGLTVWFPVHLYRSIQRVVPMVDPYTELGVPRSKSDMDREYQRLLNRDRNPLSFLYNGFRRGWGSYESMFLFAKLTTLLVTAIVDPYNCLFRSLSQSAVAISRQAVLLVAMLIFFILQCIYAPFLDPVSNASEWTSRINYVLTAAVALGVALNIPGQNILNGVILYIIYIATYGLCIYFAIINLDFMRRLVKRIARRIDFSIDIFSPRIDLSATCPHTKRRIWQESITTLFLTNIDCKIPKSQAMDFKQSRDNQYPPYLLNFAGSPGERLVENLKIFMDVGSNAYYKAIGLASGPDGPRLHRLEEIIQHHLIGPDSYWDSPSPSSTPNCTDHFGTSWWIPFPPTLIMQYDDGHSSVIQDLSQLELYVGQNTNPHIQRKRDIRLALRALDGHIVQWPYDHIQPVGSRDKWCCFGRRYGANTVVHFKTCTFSIKRRGQLLWEGADFGSGFGVELSYTKNVKIDGSAIGLTDDFDLTRPLARFLAMNELLITDQVSYIESIIRSYRHHYWRECQWKMDTLTYQFLTAVYNHPAQADQTTKTVLRMEHDPRVNQLMTSNETILAITYERYSAVSASELGAWWYIFWDDVWRRNYNTISALRTHATDFNPHYPTSIAYRPLPRAALESFLTQRGLLHKIPKWTDCFDAGFLNKMYLRMNDIVFHDTQGANILRLGDDKSDLDMEEIDAQTLTQPSTLGTGAGTDYDDVSIRARPTYRWEGILEDPLRKDKATHRPFLTKVAVWFGITPYWHSGPPSRGLALDVRLENGRYILSDNVGAEATTSQEQE
ncbi:uncharacterized protein FIBRA_01044 [Fibroporia radiculosa]|uniref:Uncharacterized protein n=1 Tax=Fibroporia radiculosa TaxID=599839 RepID=J4GJ69_9APHY|nr:uncharacterized protein FIBRA_01044 [Fibroporia radiculosa]CCL99035.1 predicted protein [Fibroporia radiculosa]